MKLILSSLVILSVLFIGTSYAYADVTISTALGSGAPGCEETTEGCYTPETVTVNVGETITFLNTDTAAHTFTSGDPDIGPSGLFDSGLAMAGSTFEWNPTEVGDVDYFCMVHPWMIGLIIVGSDTTTGITMPPQITNPIIEDDLEKENQELRNEIVDLKIENKQLKNKINSLNSEIVELKDQIVSMTKEFLNAIKQLNAWFASQLS